MKPRLLDLFCGAGGAAMGYHRAGFEVVGVDIKPQPHYPFEFVQGDALEYLSAVIETGWDHASREIQGIHASPPCLRFTRMQRLRKNAAAHKDQIGPTRELLEQTGLPWVMENVEDSTLGPHIVICGSMFDPPMEIRWHRLFEANWDIQTPVWPCRHKLQASRMYPGTPNGSGNRPGAFVVNPFASGTSHEVCAAAKGIDWIPSEGRFRPNVSINDAIPPAYTEFIGHQLMQRVLAKAAA